MPQSPAALDGSQTPQDCTALEEPTRNGRKPLIWVPQLNIQNKKEKSAPMLRLYRIPAYLVLAHDMDRKYLLGYIL